MVLALTTAASLSLATLLGYRFAVTDRVRRLLRSSFSLYLAPALIDRLIAAERIPELGGEIKTVTVLLSDLDGFTGLAERVSPQTLVALMNNYLTAMTDIIEAEGGFVCRYVGDAIEAVFGAPVDDAHHAVHGVRAALACFDRLAALNHEGAFGDNRLRARIGLSTGEVLVGNIGSRRRFNYTVMGDTVNLASRLEGANKVYGTSILVSESARLAAGGGIEWREIDRVRVKGRNSPVAIFEPLAIADDTSVERREAAAAFASALAAYRAGRFGAAAEMFAAIAEFDPAARIFAVRARQLQSMPPALPWDGITDFDFK
jgi:adenylate cyclase